MVTTLFKTAALDDSAHMTTNDDFPALSRRGALTAMAGALGGGLLPAAASARSEPPRFDDPVWNREQAARLEAHTDGKQVFGRATGSVNGVRSGEAVRHLLDFEVFSTTRVIRRPDGNYDRMSKEVVFYLDPSSGEILDSWDNPYNQQRVHVVDIANDPYNWVIRDYAAPPALPGTDTHDMPAPAEKKPFLMKWTNFSADTVVVQTGGHAWYPNRLDPAKWPRESAGTMVQASELFRYFIRRADLINPALTHLPHNGVWIRITPWLPWMLLGQMPGHILYDGMFTSADSLDYFNPAVLDRVRKRYPQYLTAPTSWYGPSLSSIEHYALEQKPAPNP
jgi:hypothetical protein